MRARNDLAAKGRQAAAGYLEERGFAVLDQDWDSPDGTIPIVAEERGVLVAVQVVTRAGGRYHDPLERAVKARRSRLRRATARWIADHGRRYDQIRIDVIGLVQDSGGFAIEHIRAVG